VRNVERLEKELDQIYIGNKKLHVNIPRYRRNVEGAKRGGSENRVQHTRKARNMIESQAETSATQDQKKTKEVWRVKTKGKSYSDAVKDDSQRRWKGPIIRTEQKVLPWMVSSVIGEFREELDYEQLGEQFVRGGMSMIRVRYMGDNLVLLTPQEGINMEELIKLNKEWFESVFQSIEPWSEEHVAGHKVVWVRCYGLPLTLWNTDCFSKVVGEVATLVSVDESTALWENLEYARLQVRLLKNCNARVSKSMRINGQTLSIFIEEEHPAKPGGHCTCHRNFFDSSDSVSSSETYVEETAQAGWSGAEKITDGEAERRTEVETEEEEIRCENRTKEVFSKVPADSRPSDQRKEPYLFTKEGTEGQKGSVEAAVEYQGEPAPQNYFSKHVDLAKLVVEIECRGVQSESKAPLGLDNNEAQFWSKGGSGVRKMQSGEICVYTRKGASEADVGKNQERSVEDYRCEQGDNGESSRMGNSNPNAVSTRDNGELDLNGLLETEVEERKLGSSCNNSSKQRKIKDLRESVEPNSHPRRSVRLSERMPQARKNLLISEGLPTISNSDGDINNCNTRTYISGNREEPANIWGLCKQVGLACRREEEEVVQELQCMEERDMEFMKNVEMGDHNVSHADF